MRTYVETPNLVIVRIIRTILIVEQIFSAYVRGNSKSRQCAYMRTILVVARKFFLRTYAETPISSLFVYVHNLNSSAVFFCVRTWNPNLAIVLRVYAHNSNNRVLFSV